MSMEEYIIRKEEKTRRKDSPKKVWKGRRKDSTKIYESGFSGKSRKTMKNERLRKMPSTSQQIKKKKSTKHQKKKNGSNNKENRVHENKHETKYQNWTQGPLHA